MYQQYLDPCLNLLSKTGELLLGFWRRPEGIVPQKKADGTPFTPADLAAHQEIVQGLQAQFPEIPVLSEEGSWPPYTERRQWRQYWLIDPLDGTRGFIAHSEQFSINLALIVDSVPVLGMIYVPAAQTCYYAVQGSGAFKQTAGGQPQRIQRLNRPQGAAWRIVIGQYSRGVRLTQLIKEQCAFQLIHVNGSVKFGWLAEGQADIYPRLGPIYEWDTAAGQCIVTESGGAVVDLQGRTLQYNCKESLLNPEFIALADASWAQQWVTILGDQHKGKL